MRLLISPKRLKNMHAVLVCEWGTIVSGSEYCYNVPLDPYNTCLS